MSEISIKKLEGGLLIERAGVVYFVKTGPRSGSESPPTMFDALLEAMSDQILKLEKALKPFANFACSEKQKCNCHNCVARDLLGVQDNQLIDIGDSDE